jgi:hypothetical protein
MITAANTHQQRLTKAENVIAVALASPPTPPPSLDNTTNSSTNTTTEAPTTPPAVIAAASSSGGSKKKKSKKKSGSKTPSPVTSVPSSPTLSSRTIDDSSASLTTPSSASSVLSSELKSSPSRDALAGISHSSIMAYVERIRMECVVCLDAASNHVVMSCMHICLCSSCAAAIGRRSPNSAVCPLCSASARDIRRVYT